MYSFKYRRYDSCKTFEEMYEQWQKDRSDSSIQWEDGERNYWKIIFYARGYGISGKRLLMMLKAKGEL